MTHTVEQWPDHAGLIWVDQINFTLGGVALNPAVTIAKLGQTPVGLIGYLGDDLASQLINQELYKLGIITTRLKIRPGQSSGICIVSVHPDGERSFIITAGANANLLSETSDLDDIAPGDYLHIGGALNIVHLPQTLARVRQRQVIVSVDVSFDSTGRWWGRLAPFFPYIDIFMANASESEQLTGTTDPVLAAQKITAAGPPCVAIKLGSHGAYIFSPTWQGSVPPFRVTALDTTGAGDAFAGALLYGLTRGWPIEQAAILANAVGALCTTQIGATTGIPSYPEMVAFIHAQGRAGKWRW
jgi:sugar/nucleoside kinase (ribokinase family)